MTGVIVVALIPAHNEAERIAATAAAVRAIEDVSSVIVVDDGSTDHTARLAEQAGATVVRLAGNVGKGAALEVGARHASGADVLLLLDADLCETASQGALLLAPVLAGEADMTIATLPRPEGKAGFGLVKGLARWGIARMGGGFEAAAPLSGQRALSSEAVAAVRPFATGYGVEVAMSIHALRAGLRLAEVPTTMAHAHTGRDIRGFLHRGRQLLHVAMALARVAFERR